MTYPRYLILRTIARVMGFGWMIPDYAQVERIRTTEAPQGYEFKAFYLIAPTGPCSCVDCQAKRGEGEIAEVVLFKGPGV
jgi:hypothetical protein